MSSKHPTVRHSGKTTTVIYTSTHSNNGHTNRPATVYRTPTTTKVVYRKK